MYVVNQSLLVRLGSDHFVECVVEGDDSHIEITQPLLMALVTARGKQPFSRESFCQIALDCGCEEISPSIWLGLRVARVLLQAPDTTPSSEATPEYDWRYHGWPIARLFHSSISHTAFVPGTQEGWEITTRYNENIYEGWTRTSRSSST
jgi:hypothetical protein